MSRIISQNVEGIQQNEAYLENVINADANTDKDISEVSISMQSLISPSFPLAEQWTLFLDYKCFSKLQIIKKKKI